jgi:hypothetical protein
LALLSQRDVGEHVLDVAIFVHKETHFFGNVTNVNLYTSFFTAKCMWTKLISRISAMCYADVDMKDTIEISSTVSDVPICSALVRTDTLVTGAFCKVYLCLDRTGKPAACKVLLNSNRGASEFGREKALLASLNHPNVVKLRNSQPGSLYEMYMEWGGTDLLTISFEMRKDHQMSWVPQILSAVQYLHSMSVAHLDLKLENIVVDATGKIRIIDLGLAVCVVYPEQLEDIFSGTAGYAAPEVLAGTKFCALSADAWSLGITLFGYGTNKFPFHRAVPGDTNFDYFAKMPWRCGLSRMSGIEFEVGPLQVAIDALVKVDPCKRAPVSQAAFAFHEEQKKTLYGIGRPVVHQSHTQGDLHSVATNGVRLV